MSRQVVERGAVRFRCRCSRRKVQRVLISLGETELHDILAEQGRVEVRCNFCAARYLFDEDDVEALIVAMKDGHAGSTTRHEPSTLSLSAVCGPVQTPGRSCTRSVARAPRPRCRRS